MSFSKSFPNLITAASYDPFFLYVSLESISSAEFKALNFTAVDQNNYKTLALIWHEMTHWIDHVATLWGQKNLVLLFNALNAWANKDEKEFWRIRNYDLASRADDFAEYYSEIYMPHTGGFRDLWKYEHTCGVRFDSSGYLQYDKPLFFTKFATSNGERISRVPVSVASVLETNAIYAEYFIKSNSILDIADPVERAIQQREMKEELEFLLYDSDLTLYSVVAHITSTPNNINDIFKTYDISSSLGTLLLNMPADLFAKMRLIPFNHEDWDDRANAMLNNGDIGFGYYNMIRNLIDRYGKDAFSIENVLSASELPAKNELELKVLEEMTFNLRKLIPGPFTLMGTILINVGIEMFTKRGLDGKKRNFLEWCKEERYYPDIVFNDTFPDTSLIDQDKAMEKIVTAGDADFKERLAVFEVYEEKLMEFTKICGV